MIIFPKEVITQPNEIIYTSREKGKDQQGLLKWLRMSLISSQYNRQFSDGLNDKHVIKGNLDIVHSAPGDCKLGIMAIFSQGSSVKLLLPKVTMSVWSLRKMRTSERSPGGGGVLVGNLKN